jgi:hypothetical protein
MYGALLCGLYGTGHGDHAHSATTAATCTNGTRSCHLGRRICSTTSGRPTKSRPLTDPSGSDYPRICVESLPVSHVDGISASDLWDFVFIVAFISVALSVGIVSGGVPDGCTVEYHCATFYGSTC